MNLEMSSPRADASGQAKGFTPLRLGAQLPCMGWAWTLAGCQGPPHSSWPPITPVRPQYPQPRHQHTPPCLLCGSHFAGEACVQPSHRASPSPGSSVAPHRARKAGGRVKQRQQVQAKEEREDKGEGATTTETRETFPGGTRAGQPLGH